MSREPAATGAATTRHATPEASLRLFASAPAVRKGRFIALLLLVNWGVMGVFVLSQGIRSLVGGLAFGLGLFALVGGLAYLRASRAATTVPLFEISGTDLRFRSFSSIEPRILELDAITAIAEQTRDAVTVRSRDGENTTIPCLALSGTDRERMIAHLAEHLVEQLERHAGH